MMLRIALLAAVALASVSAEIRVKYGNECAAEIPFPSESGFWHPGWDKCANDQHVTTSLGDECCVAQCMETLLAADDVTNASFVVCAGSDNGGVQVHDFDWAKQYCDCSFKDYCKFACCPTCDTPKVSSHNRVHGHLQSAGFMASANNETEHDVFRFKLTHDSRNLCGVFFFAIFQTGNQIVIDWTLSVLYMPYKYDEVFQVSHSCEDILVEFDDEAKKPQCGNSDLIENLGEKQCSLKLPAKFEAALDYGFVPARYIAYTSCYFKSVDVLEQDCDTSNTPMA